MRDMPFSSLRPAAFQEIVKNCNVQHVELNVVKQKFEMCQKEQGQQIKKLSENLETSELENERLQKELSEFQSREEEMKRKLSTCENLNMELKQNLDSVSKREKEANEKLRQYENSEAVSNISQYIAQIQDLHTQLQSKQSFIEFLTERYHEMRSEYQETIEAEKKNAEKEKCLREATEQAYRDKFQELEATMNQKLDLLEQQSRPRHQNRNYDYRPNHRNFRGRGRFLWRQHSGAPLRDHFVRRPSVCPSVCLSVCHTFGLLITFLPSEVGLSYLACVFLMTTPFRLYHTF